jgi:hypothetical protein
MTIFPGSPSILKGDLVLLDPDTFTVLPNGVIVLRHNPEAGWTNPASECTAGSDELIAGTQRIFNFLICVLVVTNLRLKPVYCRRDVPGAISRERFADE